MNTNGKKSARLVLSSLSFASLSLSLSLTQRFFPLIAKVGVQQRRPDEPSSRVQRGRAVLLERRPNIETPAPHAPLARQSSNSAARPRHGVRPFLTFSFISSLRCVIQTLESNGAHLATWRGESRDERCAKN